MYILSVISLHGYKAYMFIFSVCLFLLCESSDYGH